MVPKIIINLQSFSFLNGQTNILKNHFNVCKATFSLEHMNSHIILTNIL